MQSRGAAGISPAHRLAIIVAVVASAACVVLLVLLLTGGSRQAKGDSPPSKRTPATAAPSVQLRQTKLGRILTDERGLTLYLFDEDKGGKSSCFAGCAKVWPPAMVTGRPRAGSGVSAKKLTTIRRGHSGRQLVYDGHPLYRLDADARPGQTQGEGFGGSWWLVSPAGRRIIAPGLKRSKGGY